MVNLPQQGPTLIFPAALNSSIPSLLPFVPPWPTIPRKASELGCVLDCDLATGKRLDGSPATDNTALINGFLATAAAPGTVPVLILDGPTLCTGIRIPHGASAAIVGLGKNTGFYIASGSNAPGITNNTTGIAFTPQGLTPPTPAGKLLFRDFYLNCNRGNGHTGDSNTGDPQGFTGVYVFCGIEVYDAAEVVLENVEINDSPYFAFRSLNCGYTKIDGYISTAPSNAGATDGLHFDGPNQNIFLSNISIQSGDDGIALNAAEGYGGNISTVVISNYAFNAASLMRVYTSLGVGTYIVSDVKVTNCNGLANGFGAFNLSGGAAGATDAITRFKASQIFAACAEQFVYVGQNLGDVVFDDCDYSSDFGSTGFCYVANSCTISSLTMRGKCYRAGNVETIYGFGMATGITLDVGKLTLGFAIEDQYGSSFGGANYVIVPETGLTLGLLWIENVDPTHITAFTFTDFTGITEINGPGVLSCGFEIPDATMGNLCNYISATGGNAGNPCIKIAGTVKAYTIA